MHNGSVYIAEEVNTRNGEKRITRNSGQVDQD